MGFAERRDVARPATGEAPFRIGEHFFVRTDGQGIIRVGSYVLHRVSGYDWNELIGAPQRILRHPDMPAGVFRLLCNALEQGRPAGAYVRNLAKDGLHFWTFAVVMPVDGGFLSVHIKPCVGNLEWIAAIYDAMRAAEADGGMTPGESAEMLLRRIDEVHGQKDYAAFAGDALVHELIAQDRQLHRPPDKRIAQFRRITSAARGMLQETHALFREFGAISTVPANMRIIASRLESSGGAITALSQNYWAMSEEMSNWFRKFVTDSGKDFSALEDTLSECRFQVCAARLVSEAAELFSRERRRLGSVDVAQEKQKLAGLAQKQVRKAMAGLQGIVDEAGRVSAAVTTMRRYTLGLGSTRVMCNIESARLPQGGETLSNIIDQLDGFQRSVEQQLTRIEDLCRDVRFGAEMLGAKTACLPTCLPADWPNA